MGRGERERVGVSRAMAVTPERVFAELSDAWMFTGWVVGASHIRDVSDDWPNPGSRLLHTVGPWPLTISDHTEVLELDAPRRLVMQAHAWPVGEARIEVLVEPTAEGSMVTMTEWPVRGIGRWVRNPLQDLVLRRRNRESLARLASIAEKRPVPPAPESRDAHR
jgi:uncharacterized protein YndB with AHSA1/START domain